MEHWSGHHLAALVATAGVAALLVLGAATPGPRRPGVGWRRDPRRLAGEQLTYALRGDWSAEVNLPFQLTDAVTLAAVVALWRPESALLVELVYFWALTASLRAVLTPDLDESFPDPLFLTHFATHSGAVAAACQLVLGSRRAPRPRGHVAGLRCHGRVRGGRRGRQPAEPPRARRAGAPDPGLADGGRRVKSCAHAPGRRSRGRPGGAPTQAAGWRCAMTTTMIGPLCRATRVAAEACLSA